MSSEQMLPASPLQGKWDVHRTLGTFWITYWMSNLYVAFALVVPFLDYYVMTALLLIYIAFVRPNSLLEIASKPMIWLWALTAIIPALMYVNAQYGGFSTGSVKTRIVYISAIGGMALILLDDNRELLVRSAAKLSLAITIAFNLIDIVFSLDISRAEGRAAGLWMDPNITAAALCSMLIISIDPRRPTRRGLVVVAFTLLSVLLTFSRSGILFAVFLGVIYLVTPRGPGSLPVSTRFNIGLAAGLSLGLGTAVLFSVADLTTTSFWRLESLVSLDVSDRSAQGRLQALIFAFERSMDFFWTGRGLGANQYYGLASHNAYVTVLYDYGILGVLLYLFFISQGLFQMLRFGWRRAAIPGLLSTNLLYYGMFAHTLPTSAGMAVPMVIFMLKMFIEPPPNRVARDHAVVHPPSEPSLVQLDRAQ